jgi:microcystin-dependent protein
MSQVSDYNIANASGASVRSDLNAVFDAIKTLNSGGSDPSNTAAFMPYVDTADSNNLKIRNAANDGFTTVGSVNSANLGLLPRAGGTMTGQLLGDDSSVAGSPAYAFDNDTDTGMFRSGANTIGFSTSGTERVSISDAGLDVVNGLPIRLQDSSGSPFVSLKSPSALSGNIALTLPSSITNGGFLQTDGSGNLSFQIVAGVPSGSVFCMAVATVPSGYLECNGAAVSRTTYAALFAIIGTNYGTGNGSSTFNLPDLRGEFIRGFDNGRGADSGRSIASSQGASNASHNHSISLSGTTSTKSLTGSVARIAETMAAHGTASGVFTKRSNVQTPTTPNATDSSPAGGFDMDASHNHTFSASGTSGSQGSEARPRNIAMMYIIKV